MAHTTPGLDALVRQAFGLIIEIRHQRGAARSLALAVNFLRMMARDPTQEAPPIVLRLTVMPLDAKFPDSAPKSSPESKG